MRMFSNFPSLGGDGCDQIPSLVVWLITFELKVKTELNSSSNQTQTDDGEMIVPPVIQ